MQWGALNPAQVRHVSDRVVAGGDGVRWLSGGNEVRRATI
jgi:hypothetical protein